MSMNAVSREVFKSKAKLAQSGADTYAILDLYVSSYGRSFEVKIYQAIGQMEMSDKTLLTLNEIADLSPEARIRIRELLYENAMKFKEIAAYGDPDPPPEVPPQGFFRRLFWRPAKYRFVALKDNDPRHPCYLPGGSESVESKIEWLGIRIDENEPTSNRFALLDCRPTWEDEHGVTVVLRNGVPVATDDHDPDLNTYDVV